MMPEKSLTKKIILTIISLLVLVAILVGLYFFIFSKFLINKNPPETIYSNDPTEAKSALVPTDFPFEQKTAMENEFQRNLEGFLEYTAIWESQNERIDNIKIFESYMRENGWNPFVLNISDTLVSITGEKDDAVLNIFVGLNSESSKEEVQIHFSQK